jgi:DNA-binding transcriptional MerR regulator
VAYLRTIEAARLLEVTPNTLREWERRYGFPVSHPTASGTREFVFDEMVALRDALQVGMSIPAAIARARSELGTVSADGLFNAFVTLDTARCELLVELAWQLRPLERVLSEIVLRALELVVREHGLRSVQWAFSADFSVAWIRRVAETGDPRSDAGTILIADTSRDNYDRDAVYVHALGLLCRLAGFEVQMLSLAGQLDQPVPPFSPSILVIAGDELPDERVGAWACAARAALRPPFCAVYRRDPRGLGAFNETADLLPDAPWGARKSLREMTDRRLAVSAGGLHRVVS